MTYGGLKNRKQKFHKCIMNLIIELFSYRNPIFMEGSSSLCQDLCKEQKSWAVVTFMFFSFLQVREGDSKLPNTALGLAESTTV